MGPRLNSEISLHTHHQVVGIVWDTVLDEGNPTRPSGGQAVFSIVPQPIKVVAVVVFVAVVVVNRIVVAFF